MRNLPNKTYFYKVAVEEMRKRNQSIDKVQTIFQTKTHHEGFCPAPCTWDIFPAQSSSLAGSWMPPQLSYFQTNWFSHQYVPSSMTFVSFWPSCSIFRQWLPVVPSWAKSKIRLKLLMLGDAPLPGGSFLVPFGTFWGRGCQAPVDWGGGRIDNH